MAETDFHRILMTALIQTLDFWFADNPRVYVSGNLLMYYVPGNKRKHLSPDVFVVKGVQKKRRLYYLTWEEGKNPSVVIEITSASTRKEDTAKKFALYRDVLQVPEYFLFDPFGDYLKPQLKGYRSQKGEYVPIALVAGRMPSRILGLHLEPTGGNLRLYDPASKQCLLTPEERAEQEKQRAEQEKQRAEQAERENERLRQLLRERNGR
jgi:Uma2 family endonuclease